VIKQYDTNIPQKLIRVLAMRSVFCIILLLLSAISLASERTAFPGAVGWAAKTPGGRGGQIIKVTNLAADGKGSLREALNTSGPRIVVFEVGGIIDLSKQTLRITEPFITIAGQTAPSPGITIIRGGIGIGTHDVIVQHIRVRPGAAGQAPGSGWGEDAITTIGAYNVIVDHCSLTWATDENLSASGHRFSGKSPEEWRLGTSHDITFSQNIIAEGLANASHDKFEHSKGSLIHDNATNILIYGNLFAHNYERNPHLKGGAYVEIVNNFIYDPGQRAIHYNLMASEWGDEPFQNGKMTAIGNVMRAGPSTEFPIAFVMLGGHGDLEFYGRDNVVVDRIGLPLSMFGRYTTGPARIMETDEPPIEWPDLAVRPAEEVERWVDQNAGARPWDRDVQDARILMNAREGRGKIIDNEAEVGGYPRDKMTRKVFDANDWDLETMMPKSSGVLEKS